jgi:hypothetical protein
MAELTRRAATRARIGRRLALMRQADILCLTASGPPGFEASSAQQISPLSQAPSVRLLQEHPSPVHPGRLHLSWRTQWPGPPGRPGSLGQQVNPSSQLPCTPLLQRQPRLVQGSEGEPSGLQPTEDGMQVPGPPGGPFASLAQQRSVVSPQGSCVPVVQSQPTPGRDGSVQISCTPGAARPTSSPSAASRLAAIPAVHLRNAARRD